MTLSAVRAGLTLALSLGGACVYGANSDATKVSGPATATQGAPPEKTPPQKKASSEPALALAAASGAVKVVIGPQLAQVTPGAVVQFSGQVSGLKGAEAGLKWAVTEPEGGVIDAQGTFVAGSKVGEYHVVATAKGDSTKTATGVVRVESNGMIPDERITIFNPGLMSVGGIPQRPLVCKTLSPNGSDDTASINEALKACPEGQAVSLGPGTFKITGMGIHLNKSGVTLRGAGPGQTILRRADTTDAAVVHLGNLYSADKLFGSVNLAADGKKGAYAVKLASASVPPLSAGELVLLDAVTNPAVTVWSERSPKGHESRGWFSRLDRPVAQLVEVAKVNGADVTFTTPLHIDFLTSFQAQLSRLGENNTLRPATRWVGLEDVAVEKGRGGDAGGNVHFWAAAYSWVRNIVASHSLGTSVAMTSTFKCEVRDSLIHTSANPNPGGDGYLVGLNRAASDNLVENNVIWNGNKVLVMRAAGGGNVIAYNYAQDAFGEGYRDIPEVGLNASHMTTSHHVLFEGNESFNFDADSVWGNSVYVTVLRNHWTGLRTSRPPLRLIDLWGRRAVGLTRWAYWYSFFGNVLGYDGQKLFSPQQKEFKYEAAPSPNDRSGFSDSSKVAMWRLGYNGEDPSALADPKVAQTLIRHGNYDYVTRTVKWEPAMASRALPVSLYLNSKPEFFGTHPWPWVNPEAATAAERTGVLPAKLRFHSMK